MAQIIFVELISTAINQADRSGTLQQSRNVLLQKTFKVTTIFVFYHVKPTLEKNTKVDAFKRGNELYYSKLLSQETVRRQLSV